MNELMNDRWLTSSRHSELGRGDKQEISIRQKIRKVERNGKIRSCRNSRVDQVVWPGWGGGRPAQWSWDDWCGWGRGSGDTMRRELGSHFRKHGGKENHEL